MTSTDIKRFVGILRIKDYMRRINGYLFASLGIAAVTIAFAPFHDRISPTTVALAFLLIVLFAALGWGSGPAALGSIIGMLFFNYFFLTPVLAWTIADPENWVALFAFLITAITVGELSAKAKKRAVEAEAGRRELERLYHDYRIAAEQAKQAEVLRRSEKLKSALLDAVTHDLRSPLTSIKAAATTLLDEMKSEEPMMLDTEGRYEILEVINEETDRLNRFVENMVGLAKLEAGELELRRKWSSIEEIVTLARSRTRNTIGDHRLEISIGVELPSVRVDANTLAEVLYLLIENAAKYSPPGTEIRVAADKNEEGLIIISVEDEGPGVPIELREKVFDKFYRVTSDPAARHGQPAGLGMGLAIARGIVEAHGGRIWIENGRRGCGTRVSLTIPIGDEEELDL